MTPPRRVRSHWRSPLPLWSHVFQMPLFSGTLAQGPVTATLTLGNRLSQAPLCSSKASPGVSPVPFSRMWLGNPNLGDSAHLEGLTAERLFLLSPRALLLNSHTEDFSLECVEWKDTHKVHVHISHRGDGERTL